MVDVWNELGKALGRALKPLAEMGSAIWSAFGEASSDLIKGFVASTQDIKTAIEPTIISLLPNIISEAADALSPDSPPEEIKEAVEKFMKLLTEMIETKSVTEGESLPTPEELSRVQANLVGNIIIMYATTHAISMAMDASHPLKEWGFKAAVMDMLHQFKMEDVIGPIIQAPIWASVVTPMRMLARAKNPYDVPGSAILPYLMAKKIINDESYKLNMSYHAFDGSWSDALLANTWRYPGFGDMRTMIHRGVKTWDDAKRTLEMNLVAKEYIEAYKTIIPSLPGFSDLRRYAVRESFPDADTFLEHFEKMKYWMGQQGYSEYFAQADWDAHWIIITASQADDLLHRGEITPEEHTALYILNDIKPEMIPALRGLTWKLPGRIESRWMFRWGEINSSDLRDYLIKDGLNPVYADKVASAMAKNQFLSDINREIANLKSDYTRGYSVETNLREGLNNLGLRSEIVEYHAQDAMADRTRGIKDDELRTLRSQYARGALNIAAVVEAAEKIILDETAREAWILALPTAKQVLILEETYGTEVNRLVSNAKYDYVRGYILKKDLVSRLQLLELPDAVIEFHVMDADEDRTRKRSDERLVVIKDMWMKDFEQDFNEIAAWAKEVIVEPEALELWLGDTYFDKHKTRTIELE